MGVAETFHEILATNGGDASGKDEDIINYIINMLEDEDFEFGENGEDAVDAIGPFLAPVLATRKLDEAVGLGQQFAKKLTDVVANKYTVAETDRSTLVVDHNAIQHREKTTSSFPPAPTLLLDHSAIQQREKPSSEQKQAEKRAERAAKQAFNVAEQQAAIASEIETSRKSVPLLRAKHVLGAWHGAGRLGALEMGPLTLPNPGGGADLLDDASCVLAQYVERRLLLEEGSRIEESTKLSDVERHTEIELRLEEIGSQTADERARVLLRNLGFTDALLARAMKNLSGGWKVRSALTSALSQIGLEQRINSKVLWLSRELASSDIWAQRIVVVVSHDRCFIEDACTDMMHISGVARRLTQHPGRYRFGCRGVRTSRREDQQLAWKRKSELSQLAWKRKSELRQAKRDKLDSYASHGFKYGGSSGQISMQQKMLKQIAVSDKEDEELPLRILAGGQLAKPAAVLQNVAFNYPGQEVLFRGAEFTIDSRSRVCLLGENGNGKTTLLKVIMDQLKPTEGSVMPCPPGCPPVMCPPGRRIEIVNQHHADQLHYDQTPLKNAAEHPTPNPTPPPA
eukprot:gene30623-35634_t